MERVVTKVLLVGNNHKTTLRRAFMGENFKTDIFNAIGCDFAIKQIDLNPYFSAEYQIWDINGHEEFKKLRQKFYTGVSSLIFVFDISDIESLYDLKKWFTEICEFSECIDIKIALFGISNEDNNDRINEEDINVFITNICDQFIMNPKYFKFYELTMNSGEIIELCFRHFSEYLYEDIQTIEV